MKKIMKFSVVMCVCMVALVCATVAVSYAERVKFHGCSPKYPNLCATNVSDQPLHLFLTMKTLGCNGAETPQPGAQYELIKGKDYTDEKLNASYFWKISHYNYFYILPGQTAMVQAAPCYEGRINYGHLGRAFTFTPEKWEHFKSMVYAVNPKCPWAQPSNK